MGAALASGTELVLELSGVTFIDSAGLRSLIRAQRRRGRRRLAGVALAAPSTLRVLEITGLTDELTVEPASDPPDRPTAGVSDAPSPAAGDSSNQTVLPWSCTDTPQSSARGVDDAQAPTRGAPRCWGGPRPGLDAARHAVGDRHGQGVAVVAHGHADGRAGVQHPVRHQLAHEEQGDLARLAGLGDLRCPQAASCSQRKPPCRSLAAPVGGERGPRRAGRGARIGHRHRLMGSPVSSRSLANACTHREGVT